jgi:hypothetical protein
VTSIVLDCGALIALERKDRAMWADLRAVAMREGEAVVPSTALAQAWRGVASQALLARALRECAIAAFDPLARAVGELCGRTRTKDVCDAHVAIVAAIRGDVLYTSDPADMARLLSAIGGRRPTIVRC